MTGKNKPYLAKLEKGKRYAWCACGRSQNQPFCDGSHEKIDSRPHVFTAEKTEELLLCGCKHTKSPPFCDGSHNNLEDAYEVASDEEIASSKAVLQTFPEHQSQGKAILDGGSFVLSPDMLPSTEYGPVSVRSLIAQSDGAQHLNLVSFTFTAKTHWRRHDGGDTALYIFSGTGTVNIEGVAFSAAPETGVFVRQGEAFRLEPETPMYVLAAISPDSSPAHWLNATSGDFDKNFPDRRVGIDPAAQEKMADRFYQVLVGSEIGSEEMTQFIGEIPKSRAAFHRHLYEEAIVILSGEGFMWTRNRKAAVKPGDVIYLPPRQEHSLECTAPEGMRLMGVFYPAGSPAINY